MALATQATIDISSATQGNKRLRRVKSSKVSRQGSTELETAMGEDDAVGFIDKPGGFTITLSVLAEQGKPEVDYDALIDTKEVFSLTRSIVGGPRFQYVECRVSKADPDDDDQGKHMIEVEIVALRRRRLPS